LKRLDLVVKPVLRKIRKYYVQYFHDLTNYSKIKRREGNRDALRNCIEKFITLYEIKEN